MHTLHYYFETLFPAQVSAYEQFMLGRALRVFDGIEAESEQLGTDRFHELSSSPGEGDLADLAERAKDDALAYYESASGVAQGLTNLVAAGVFHLFEQQRATFVRELNRFDLPTPDFASFPSYPILGEARLVANVVKHAEGDSAEKLRKCRADLFVPQSLRGLPKWMPNLASQPVEQPLVGEGLYLSESDIRIYSNGLRSLWSEIACALAQDAA